MDASEDEELKKLIHADFTHGKASGGNISNGGSAGGGNGGNIGNSGKADSAVGGKKKPKKVTGKAVEKPALAQLFLCEKCEKTYKTKSGLIKHKTTCLK
jgi:hypothetical protein